MGTSNLSKCYLQLFVVLAATAAVHIYTTSITEHQFQFYRWIVNPEATIHLNIMADNNTASSPSTSPGVKLTDTQIARIERNRQKALLLKQSKLLKRPHPEDDSKQAKTARVTSSTRIIDSGAGFLIEENDDEVAEEVKVIHEEGALLDTDSLNCEECDKEFVESYLHNTFQALVCDKCRDPEKHRLVTKTDAKDGYLLKDRDLDKWEPPLKFIVKKNPRNDRWGDMKLYYEPQVAERALEIWGSEEALEEAKEQKITNKEKSKQKKIVKKVKELRMAVRSSLWTKDLGPHEHDFGEEEYDEANDEYKKICRTCGHVMSYEKM